MEKILFSEILLIPKINNVLFGYNANSENFEEKTEIAQKSIDSMDK
jgi:hypothetical protein